MKRWYNPLGRTTQRMGGGGDGHQAAILTPHLLIKRIFQLTAAVYVSWQMHLLLEGYLRLLLASCAWFLGWVGCPIPLRHLHSARRSGRIALHSRKIRFQRLGNIYQNNLCLFGALVKIVKQNYCPWQFTGNGKPTTVMGFIGELKIFNERFIYNLYLVIITQV